MIIPISFFKLNIVLVNSLSFSGLNIASIALLKNNTFLSFVNIDIP